MMVVALVDAPWSWHSTGRPLHQLNDHASHHPPPAGSSRRGSLIQPNVFNLFCSLSRLNSHALPLTSLTSLTSHLWQVPRAIQKHSLGAHARGVRRPDDAAGHDHGVRRDAQADGRREDRGAGPRQAADREAHRGLVLSAGIFEYI